MASSDAKTVSQYLESLPPDRREAIAAVRRVILENVPEGYEECMDFGMIGYVIPLARYPKTYNGHPLGVAALASQKNHMALYLMCVYADPDLLAWFKEEFEAAGKKLDMGKSCVRFKKLDDLPLDVIGKVIGKVGVEDYLARYEAARSAPRARPAPTR